MSFLAKYLDFTQGQEATERVHRWVGISVVAGALERKVWLPRGSYTLYPNLYTFIVGPSGVVRKSTSTAIGVNLLRELEGIKVMSERMTAATLIAQMERSHKVFTFSGREIKQSATFAYASELAVFLGEVFGSISELLTTFYDCVPNDSSQPWTYETRGNGIQRVFGPCLNILGASTPTWLVRSIPPSEMEGGFASRVIFVVESEARRSIAWPDLETRPDDYESKKRFLASELKRIHSLSGPFSASSAFRTQGKLWYDTHQKNLKANRDLRFSGYYGRKFDTVLKVAMALNVSRGSTLQLEIQDLEESLHYLDDIEKNMFNAFGAHGENPNSKLIEKVWDLLVAQKQLHLSTILRHLRRDTSHERLLSVMEDLRVMNRVRQSMDPQIRDYLYTALEPEKPL